MKKKGTIGIVATLGLGLCAYALSQQPQVKEEKRIRFSICKQIRNHQRLHLAKGRQHRSGQCQGKDPGRADCHQDYR